MTTGILTGVPSSGRLASSPGGTPMAHTYLVDLTATAQEDLYRLIKQGKPSARQVARAPMLLQAAAGATAEAIAATLRVGLATVHRTRPRLVEEGLTSALPERRRPGAR